MRKQSLYKFLGVAFTVAMVSCTDLKEQVLDEVLLGSNITNPDNALSAAYGQLGNSTFVDHANVFGLQEYSTDEAMLPTRGSDWGDGGVYRAIHEFTWAPDNSLVTNTWNNLTFGITQSLAAVTSANETPNFASKTLYIAEARGLAAYYTYNTLDLFGQAPYRNPYTDNAVIEVLRADTAIDRLIKEVEAIIPDLATLKEQNTHNGRFTKQAAYGLLADMYLNRAVFKNRYGASFDFTEAAVDGNGTDMDKVIFYTSKLIDDPMFSLETNYFRNFDIDNNGRPELIFVVSQAINTLRSSDNDFAYMPMERNQKPSAANRGTNASCTTPEFYYTWNDNHDDPRFQRAYQYSNGTWFKNEASDTLLGVPATSIVKGSSNPWFHFTRGFLVGQQYGPILLASGKLKMNGSNLAVEKLVCEKNTNLAMDFTPEMNFDDKYVSVLTQDQINRGVRIFKYEFDPEKDNSSTNVDIPLYRLGGIYCMRAEAYFRSNQPALALADINKLRTTRTREELYGSAPGKAITTLDANSLYNEIAFETYWEMMRRKEAIRFGKFELEGTAKRASEPYRRIYPIPQSVMDASKVFQQNQGY
jgi:hypothetical protein